MLHKADNPEIDTQQFLPIKTKVWFKIQDKSYDTVNFFGTSYPESRFLLI